MPIDAAGEVETDDVRSSSSISDVETDDCGCDADSETWSGSDTETATEIDLFCERTCDVYEEFGSQPGSTYQESSKDYYSLLDHYGVFGLNAGDWVSSAPQEMPLRLCDHVVDHEPAVGDDTPTYAAGSYFALLEHYGAFGVPAGVWEGN